MPAQTVKTPGRRGLGLRLLLPVLVLALALAGFAALRATRAKRPPVVVSEQAYLVQVMSAEPGTRIPELLLYGRVESPRTTALASGVTADVMQVPAREGVGVQSGDVLVRLDERDIRLRLDQRQADVDEAEAQIASEQTRFRADQQSLEMEKRVLDLSRAEVTRLESLQGRGLSSESLRDQARQALERNSMSVVQRQQVIDDHDARLASLQARLRRARAQRDQAALDLERTQVRAPFSGRVTRVEVSPGDRVASGTPLLEIFDRDAVELRVQIPSRQLPVIRRALQDGVPVGAVADVDGVPVALTLDRLAARADPASGGVDALFALARGHQRLTIGRIVPLLLSLPEQADLVALPLEALYGLDRVYVLDDGRMRGVSVERVGETRSGDQGARVLVRSPQLSGGDLIVVTQLPNAVSGLLVNVVEDTLGEP